MHKEKPLVEIRTSTLVEGVNELDYTLRATDFEGRKLTEAGFAGEISIHVAARKSDEEIAVTIETSAQAHVTCDRCLAPVSRVLAGSLDLFYTFSTPVERGIEENDDIDEYRHIAKSTEYIDITDDVCDALILSIPLKVTCTDNPECRVYRCNESTAGAADGMEQGSVERSAWQESLEKLKSNIVN